jgi:GNAT superfamily N-acetyltransferase
MATLPTFFPATTADLDDLLALMREFYAEEGLRFDEVAAYRALAALLSDPALGRAWIVDADGEPAGHVVLAAGFSLEFGGRFGLLDEIYLRPPFRGRGWGRAALGHVARAAKDAGYTAIRLEVERHNGKARSLYTLAGYEAHERDLMTRFLA